MHTFHSSEGHLSWGGTMVSGLTALVGDGGGTRTVMDPRGDANESVALSLRLDRKELDIHNLVMDHSGQSWSHAATAPVSDRTLGHGASESMGNTSRSFSANAFHTWLRCSRRTLLL